MPTFCIIETIDGWTIVERNLNETPAEAAERMEGALIDAGPYDNYDDAYDALTALQFEAEGDVPAHHLHDGFYERE